LHSFLVYFWSCYDVSGHFVKLWDKRKRTSFVWRLVLPKVRIPPLYSSVILTYLLTTRRVPGYPLNYPVGYPDNELPDNGSPSRYHGALTCDGGVGAGERRRGRGSQRRAARRPPTTLPRRQPRRAHYRQRCHPARPIRFENFRIGPSLSNRIESGGRFEFESNLEASQVPTFKFCCLYTPCIL